MKINNKKIRSLLIFLLIAQSINLVMFKGLQITSQDLGNYIYSITAQPFLFQAPTIHKDLSLGATKNSLMR